VRINFYSTGSVAAQASVHPSTLILWERQGLIPPAARISYGVSRWDRIYSAEDAAMIVRLARKRGLGHEEELEAA
jgi:DNA-binding transcriptional MerR regulator